MCNDEGQSTSGNLSPFSFTVAHSRCVFVWCGITTKIHRTVATSFKSMLLLVANDSAKLFPQLLSFVGNFYLPFSVSNHFISDKCSLETIFGFTNGCKKFSTHFVQCYVSDAHCIWNVRAYDETFRFGWCEIIDCALQIDRLKYNPDEII